MLVIGVVFKNTFGNGRLSKTRLGLSQLFIIRVRYPFGTSNRRTEPKPVPKPEPEPKPEPKRFI